MYTARDDRGGEVDSEGFNPGCRLSGLDVVVLIIGGVATLAVGWIVPWLGAAIAFVAAHFFLFCNIIRMARPNELAWSAIFLSLAVMTVGFGWLTWPVSYGLSLIATVVLVAVELRKPSYHGVFWRRLNPGLPQWWEARKTEGGSR